MNLVTLLKLAKFAPDVVQAALDAIDDTSLGRVHDYVEGLVDARPPELAELPEHLESELEHERLKARAGR